MCGACGAASARSAVMHWSTPFLGSVPARTAAARNLSVWVRATGARLTVSGVAGGFQLATASGRRQLAGDLGAVVDQLVGTGIDRAALLGGAAGRPVIEGPAMPPPPRSTGEPAAWAHVLDPRVEGADVVTLSPDPRRRYRVPALLAWLAVADGTGVLDAMAVELDLGGGRGLALEVSDGAVVSGQIRSSGGADRVLVPAGRPSAGLLDLLG